MIKCGNEISARDAAIRTVLNKMEHLGIRTQEKEMFLAMTSQEIQSFILVYTDVYNTLAFKIDAPVLDSREFQNKTVDRVLLP